MTARASRLAVVTLLLGCVPASARADWLVTPFVGSAFGVGTSFFTLEVDAVEAKHLTFGASGAWLSDHILGAEADLAFAPGFFESGDETLVTDSGVTTLFGNILIAVPVNVTRDSLRPFILGGMGLVHASITDQVNLVGGDNALGIQLGGGALGMVTDRAGIRFDLRHVRTMNRDIDPRGDSRPKLSFWRAAVGVVLRY